MLSLFIIYFSFGHVTKKKKDIACVNILNQLIFFFLISGDQCYTMNTVACTVLFHRHDSDSQGVDV